MKLVVDVLQLRNSSGFSFRWNNAVDPYCIVKYGNIEFVTDNIGTNPLKPSQRFEFPVESQVATLSVCVLQEKEITFELFRDSTMEESKDVVLGAFDIQLDSTLEKGSDRWYPFGEKDHYCGQIRICVYSNREGDSILNVHDWLYRKMENQTLLDHYGFEVPMHSKLNWHHLQGYFKVREEWQSLKWSEFLQKFGVESLEERSEAASALIHGGLPWNVRQKLYMVLSGADRKRKKFKNDYYVKLVRDSDTMNSTEMKQIELDIRRTFGHSRTKISTPEGLNALRRVLRAYSIRNPAIGYCQGLNFLVGFFLLELKEENVFWLLSCICEDLYPGYYTPTMLGTQTDMLVLKELIADRLPQLDQHAESIEVPLELIGSQWLLCLFTTTFPAVTILRIFDCILFYGPSFIFAVVLAHLRQEQSVLVKLKDFQSIISHLKRIESGMFDADRLIFLSMSEFYSLSPNWIQSMQVRHRNTIEDEIQRINRVRELQQQLALVQRMPAFSNYAAQILQFCHQEAACTNREQVAFFLKLVCHGIIWFAEKATINMDNA